MCPEGVVSSLRKTRNPNPSPSPVEFIEVPEKLAKERCALQHPFAEWLLVGNGTDAIKVLGSGYPLHKAE